MHYKLAIFDFDGTLADSGKWMSGVLNRVALRFDFRQTSPAEIEMLRGLPNREIIRYLGVPAWKLPVIAVYVRQLQSEEADQYDLFQGTQDMLARLDSGGVVLGVVSSNSEDNVRRALGAETAALIKYYECGASLFGKAAKFKRILKRSGIQPGEAIAIGDESRDLEAACSAGIPSGAVTWGYATAELLRSCQPTEVFESIDQIPARLLDM